MIDIKNIILNTSSEQLETIISPFIEQQFPLFMQRDYRKLVLFIKSYYEWMEKQGNPGFVLSRLNTIYDVDRSLEEFYDHFKSTYLEGFTEVFATNIDGNKPNKNTLLKQIRDFYGNKGTENAYKFLFRVLYDSDLEFYYPKSDVLKTSDGKWIENTSIKTTSANGSVLFSAKETTVYQYNGNTLLASAEIDNVVQYNQDGFEISEFFLKNMVGTFVPNTPVLFVIGGEQYTEMPYNVLGEFYVSSPGQNFRIGDKAYIVGASGKGFAAYIQQTGLGGTIKKIGVKNSGINYFSSIRLAFISDKGNVTSAVVEARPTILTHYPGYYSGNDGQLSSTKKTQDGHYYQDFSYELKSAVSLETYYDVLRNLIHPAGMRMFGSILVQAAIENTPSTSVQATTTTTPLIGKYTPYTHGTTIDLRANGATVGTVGAWLVNYGGVTYGTTGDLYPVGYNPYVGSTAEVGLDGKTAPLGTEFIGTSLGYTYCVMVENGITAHSPLGAPLGSTAAFYRNAESNLDPSTIKGMQLWLKPENLTAIGGGSAAGASLAVWTDASPMANHGVLPTWDRWNEAVVYMKRNAVLGWDKIMWHPDPVDVVEWRCGIYGPPVSGVNYNIDPSVLQIGGFWSGGTTAGSTSGGGGAENNGLGVTSDISYFNLQFGWNLSITSHITSNSSLIYARNDAIPNGVSTSVVATLPTTFTQSTVFGLCYDYENRNINAYIDGVVYRKTGPYPEGSTFSFELVPYGASAQSEVLRASYQGTQLSSTGWTCSAGLTFFTPLGKTMEFLAPTISKNNKGIAGRDGLSFDGLVIFSPYSVWGYSGGSATLRSLPALPFVPGGFSAELLLKGKHFYLTRGLTLTNEMDAFMVFHSDSDDYGVGLGLASSNLVYAKDITNLTDDTVFFNRSWNKIDRTVMNNPALTTADYYAGTTLANGLTAWGYDSTVAARLVGLAGFRPAGASTTATQKIVVYDPHVSGVCMETCVAEWTRDSENMVQSFYNGDESKNYSPTTGMYSVDGDRRVVNPGFTTNTPIGLGRFGVYKRTSRTTEAGHNWLNPTLTWAGDGSTFSASGVGLGGVTLYAQMYRGTPTYKIVAGSNAYLQSINNNDWSKAEKSTVWTFSAYLKRSDSAAIGQTGVYLYHNGSNSYNTPGTVVSVGDGWYNISGSTSGALGSISLVGFVGLSQGITYSIADARLEKYASAAPVGSSAWFDAFSANTPQYGFVGVINEVLIWDRKLNPTERQQVYSYLSRKYQLDKALPTTFVGTHPSAPAGTTFWEIAHHPNSTQLVTPPAIYANTATLVDSRGWTVGSGSIGTTFLVYSPSVSAENNRVMSTDPWNKAAVVWQATSQGATFSANYPITSWGGAFITNNLTIDRTKIYRFSVWMRRTVDGSTLLPWGMGTFYHGIVTSSSNNPVVAGIQLGALNNPYGLAMSVESPDLNEWVLCVFHVYPNGTTKSTTHQDTGVWRTNKAGRIVVVNIADLAWNLSDTTVRQRLGLYGSYTTGPGSVTTTLQYAYPRVEACDGTEPSLADLLQGYPVNTNTIPTGVNFGNIYLRDFSNAATSIYRSANTRLLDGTVLSGDTYDYA